MVKFYTKSKFYLFLFAGFLCLLTTYYLDIIRESENIVSEGVELTQKFRENLNNKVQLIQKTFVDIHNQTSSLEKIRSKKLNLQIYKSDSLVYWDNSGIENLNAKNLLKPWSIKVLGNGIYLTATEKKDDTTFVLFYLIRNNFELNKAYLINSLNSDFNISEFCSIGFKEDEGYSKIDLNNGTVCYVKFDIQQGYSIPGFWIFIAGLIFLGIALKYVLDVVFKIDFVLGITVLLTVAISVQLIMTIHHIPQYLYLSEIFHPAYFASSDFIPSFGALVITVLLFSAGILASVYYLGKLNATNTLKISAAGRAVLLFYIINAAYFTIMIIHNLVIDSKISFDLSNAFDLSWFSLAGVLIIILMYIVTINLSHVFSKGYIKQKLFGINNVIMLLMVVVWVWILTLIQKDDFHNSKIITAFLFLILLVIAKKIFSLKSFLVRHLTYALIFVNIAAVSFYFDLKEKAISDSSSYANRLTTQIDYKAEELLKIHEKNILSDSAFINECFKNNPTNTQVTQALTAKYINNYLEKFDCSAYLFLNDSSKTPPSTYTVAYFDNIFTNQGIQGQSDNFRFVKSPADFFGYIGKFEIVKNNINLKLFVVLKLQPYQDDNLLPILLAGKTSSFKRNKLEYSYAIYSNNKLMQQAGTYPYHTRNSFEYFSTGKKVVKENGLSHVLHKDSEELLVVVTFRPPSLLSILANALCLYILTLITGALIILFDFVFCYFSKEIPEKGLINKAKSAWKLNLSNYDLVHFKFSTRIIINILQLVLFIFSVTTIFTILYIDNKINEEAKTALVNKLKSINKYITEEKLLQGVDNLKEAESNLVKASSLFSSDINIYDLNGRLYMSSRPEIFKEGLLTDKIKYSAYKNIVNEKASLYTENESIGELQYTSYYQPYYDRNRNLTYIINTPYFTRSIEHNTQISMFIVNFLNLYVAFLFIMFMIAYIVAQRTTQPFILLRDKLKLIRLERDNELLDWQRNDEIGELIKQYNSMVLDLKESKENLANAERTEAWREMAKQVAHDIKNPLTPMKLNLQYLQKAIEENDEELNQKLISVSNSLIKQIESLTEMANNFSNFAKVPDALPQKLNLNEEVELLAELYRATDFMEIRTTYHKQNVFAWMDKHHFSRAVGNIIKNAIQAIPQNKDGRIQIDLDSRDGYAELSVKDNGIGISPEMEHLVFIPNFSTKTSGSGIGLSITKNLIENAEGSVSFQSKINEGTTFLVRLPLYKTPLI